MGLVDAFGKEDRVEVKFSDFYKMMRESAKAEIIVNGVKNKVPHKYMAQMIGVKLDETDRQDC